MISQHFILAHRGLWSEPREQNSLHALVNAVQLGFGVEIDVRDSNNELVISHSPPEGDEPKFREFLESVLSPEVQPVIALNVKADGLLRFLEPSVVAALPGGSFFFDMSTPETIRYGNANLPTAVRISEYERMPDLTSAGTANTRTIWLDSFDSDWWLDLTVDELVPDGWAVYIVSPELHGREPDLAWERLQERDWEGKVFGICTDYPVEFFEFIGGSVA